MTEIQDQNSEISEVAPQVEAQVHEATEATQAQEPVTNQHLKAMRLKNDKLERELNQLREAQMQMMQAQLANVQPSRQEPDELDQIGEEEFIPLGKVRKLTEKTSQKVLKNAEEIVRQEVQKALQQRDQDQFLERLNRKYSDFSEVVTPETLSILEEKEPELAAEILAMKDPYKMGFHSYKHIKAMGLSKTAKEVRREKEVDKAIEKAEKAVTSPMAYSKRPIAQAIGYTKAQYKDLYREMHGYAALASSVPEMT